ncbi:MAG: ATP-binding protein [Terriglobales bacterium]
MVLEGGIECAVVSQQGFEGSQWPAPPQGTGALGDPGLGPRQHFNLVRAAHAVTYPARFMLAAAMNPCPCMPKRRFGA